MRDAPDAGGRNAQALSVEDLEVAFMIGGRLISIVRSVSFAVPAGSTVALVGESGSGKSVSGLAILGLNGASRRRRVGGRIIFRSRDGREVDLVKLSDQDFRDIRGNEIAMIFQEPMTALNPVMRVRDQIAEVLFAHGTVSQAAAYEAALEMLVKVGIPEPRRRMTAYPHQLSGGMRQRVMIAIALACSPRLLIADEPTTALDVTIQAQILSLLRQMRDELGTGILLITHDLGVVAENAERVVVMYAGAVMEEGRTREVLDRPRHPYTRALLNAIPRYRSRGTRLEGMPGTVPTPGLLPTGCVFHPRCAHAVRGRCDVAEPPLEIADGDRSVRCVRWREIAGDLGQ